MASVRRGLEEFQNAIDVKFSLLDPSFKASSLPGFPPLPPPLLFFQYRGDSFFWDSLKKFEYFQVVTLQQDQDLSLKTLKTMFLSSVLEDWDRTILKVLIHINLYDHIQDYIKSVFWTRKGSKKNCTPAENTQELV